MTVEDLESESDYAGGTRKSQLQQEHTRALQTRPYAINATVQPLREAWV